MKFLKRMFQKAESVYDAKERTLFNMRVGDRVSYESKVYHIVSKLSYNDRGFQWYAYQLEGIAESIWLSVEMDDRLELGIYRRASLKLIGPPSEKIEYNNRIFYLQEQGVANVRGEGRGKNVSGMNVRYFDYKDETDENYLSVEIWDSEVEVSEGYEVNESEIKIITESGL